LTHSQHIIAFTGAGLTIAAVVAGLLTLQHEADAPFNGMAEVETREIRQPSFATLGEDRFDPALLDQHIVLETLSDTARLARCAWLVSDSAPPTVEDALLVLQAEPEKTEAMGCRWFDGYEEWVIGKMGPDGVRLPTDPPTPPFEYEATGQTTIRLCAELKRYDIAEHLDHLSTHRREWIEYAAPEFSAPITELGRRCYDIDLTRTKDFN
jgi:hypothetical protein